MKYCIAAACSNTGTHGVSFFKFPSDPILREKWTKEVKRTRDRWSGPSKHSVLCEKHFPEECFEPDSAIALSMGLLKRKRLRPNAVPTIFERQRQPLPLETSDEPSCSGVRKKRSAGTAIILGAESSKIKRPRKAFHKRERSRVRHEL